MRWGRGMWLGCAVATIAVSSVLIGCTQLQTHDTLASFFEKRPAAVSTPEKSTQEPNIVPREIDHPTLPLYIIEAPDVLMVEAEIRDPKTGRTAPLPDEPISGTFQVRLDGTIGLGMRGSVSVTGLTVDGASEAIRKAIREYLANHPSATPGMDHLSVRVEVIGYNSKRYYVITEAADKTEQVHACPLTGAETVLDAIGSVDGLAEVMSKKTIRVVRKQDDGTEKILPVDWRAITQNGVTTTNYSLQSGDRIYVTRK